MSCEKAKKWNKKCIKNQTIQIQQQAPMRALLLDALRCSNLGPPPVWLMRQAGRYMPQYRALRERYSLWELFHNPELAARVTLLPIDLLDVDAAIIFSDILVIAECLGLQIAFPDTGGPR